MMLFGGNACASSLVVLLMLVSVSNAYNHPDDDYNYGGGLSHSTTTTEPEMPPGNLEDMNYLPFFSRQISISFALPPLYKTIEIPKVDYNVDNGYNTETG